MKDKIRVLIVDDEMLARRRVQKILNLDADIEIIGECSNGRDAVAAIESKKPDLVFLDVQMPEIDGFNVLEAIEEDNLPFVIFVTAYEKYAVRAFEVHAVDYLLKPFGRAR